jgi:signal transduction histidine kinase
MFAQVAQVLILITIAYSTGARPLFNAWVEQEIATIQRHQLLLGEVAQRSGIDAATTAARALSVAEIRHQVVSMDEFESHNSYLGMLGENWRALAVNETGPAWYEGELRWITLTEVSNGDTGADSHFGILSAAYWPVGRVVESNPASIAVWAGSGLLFSALAGGLVAAWFTGPILRLRDCVTRFAAGDLDARPSHRLRSRRDEIGGFARELARMEDRIATLVGAQRELLDDVAHELRSPLARMNIAIELAEQTSVAGSVQTDTGESKLLFERIRRECEQLASMINRLLELSALENQLQDDGRAEVNLTRLVREIADDCDFEAKAVGRRVDLRADPEIRVLGNEDMLRSAIENVVRNAVRYTPADQPVEIDLRTSSEECDRAVIVVRDHGPGVSEDVLPKLFQPFYRVESDRSKDSGGTGLGLALADRVVRVHAGTITARNHAEGGLEFIIEFPSSAIKV